MEWNVHASKLKNPADANSISYYLIIRIPAEITHNSNKLFSVSYLPSAL
jgi:hypothetical protein